MAGAGEDSQKKSKIQEFASEAKQQPAKKATKVKIEVVDDDEDDNDDKQAEDLATPKQAVSAPIPAKKGSKKFIIEVMDDETDEKDVGSTKPEKVAPARAKPAPVPSQASMASVVFPSNAGLSVPKNTLQFDRAWKKLRGDPQKFFAYFKVLSERKQSPRKTK